MTSQVKVNKLNAGQVNVNGLMHKTKKSSNYSPHKNLLRDVFDLMEGKAATILRIMGHKI